MSIDTSARPVNRSWLIGGVLATIAALVIGGVAVWAWATDPEPRTEDQTQTFTQPVGRVELDLAAGHVTLTAGEAGQVAVERRLQWKSSKPTIREEWTGDTLRITVRCPGDGENCAVDYRVRVPAEVSIQAGTGAGDFSVRDLTGEVSLETGAGEANLDNLSGKLRLHSAAGDVTATGLRSAETDLDTDAGHLDLRYSAAPTSVRAETGAGDIRIAVPEGTGAAGADGYRVTAETGDGDREVTVRENSTSPRAITATTAAGHISVGPA